ncbi:CpsD/CapB family tyrosine-protein kinase [Bacillus sp. WLY-B-L8]|uniref:CpsD/CapB family tyrosine-protein kinase n=1 Tax=Bacillus multifaciens TaxID=3068506 RepID=UPI0027413DC3|nr:CpsD/CapB family tyrosine-protein kinase [Bacillus sp. WLY-B-L8]MDP7977898.1 CpsD/CapB family tyrosine-protein kinase [Bacillus sp. WLY-B-L8]
MFKVRKRFQFDPSNIALKEQFYTICNNIQTYDLKLLTITSVKDRGDIAPIIVNLGFAFAEMHKRTLLVDMNLHTPKLHEFLSMDSSVTVQDLLVQTKIDYECCVSKISSHLYCIPAKKSIDDSTKLLSLEVIDSFIEEWKQIFDYILFYTAETLEAPGSQIITKKCEGVLLAVKRNKDSLRDIVHVKKKMERNKSIFLGTMLYS